MATAMKKRRPAYRAENRKNELSIAVADAFSELEALREEMETWADNLENGNLGSSPKFEQVRECQDQLDNALNNGEPEPPDDVIGLTVEYVEYVNSRKGRGPSRASRRDGAVSALEGAVAACEKFMEEIEKDDHSELEDFVNGLNEMKDGAEAAEFPDMF